jgi:hypothetical protein
MATCDRVIRGFYGELSMCARPKGHGGRCFQVYDPREHRDRTRESGLELLVHDVEEATLAKRRRENSTRG